MKTAMTGVARFLFALLLAGLEFVPLNASATPRTVTSLNDDGGVGTLRTLIGASVNGDTINFAVTGTIILTNGEPQSSAELFIGRNLTIVGPGARVLTVSGNNTSRVFNILTSVTVSISGLTIASGKVVGPNGTAGTSGNPYGTAGGDADGGGIVNSGTLTIWNCALSQNSVSGGTGGDCYVGYSVGPGFGGKGGSGNGGGIYSSGTLTIWGCTMNQNTASGATGGEGGRGGSGGSGNGGAIYSSGALAIWDCTMNQNTASGSPGVYGGFDTSVSDTSGGNGGDGDGGAIYGSSTLTMTNCTLAANQASGGSGGNGGIYETDFDVRNGSGGNGGSGNGGGIYGDGSFENSIIANNSITGGRGGAGGYVTTDDSGTNGSNGSTSGPDVDGAIRSQGHNLIGKSDGSSGWTGSDLTGLVAAPLNPLLGPLQDNGGPTYTMALLATSAAIDAGDDAVTNSPYNLITDQRGYSRKFGAHVDIGAFEFQPIIVTTTADNGPGSLRQALLSARSGDTISFAGGVTGTIALTSGELAIGKDLNISGPGATNLAISGSTASRVFNITNVTVNISGLTIRDGLVSGGFAGSGQTGRANQGGGILNYGTLSLTGCEIASNTVFGGAGGSSSSGNGGYGGSGLGAGIASLSSLALTNCYVHDNYVAGGHGGSGGTHAPGAGGNGQGGGIYSASNLTLVACAISANTATFGTHGTGSGDEGINGAGFGGGLNSAAAGMTIYLSTIADNTASGYGGGISCNPANFSISASTIAGNLANPDGSGVSVGGGIYEIAGVCTISDTIVAANIAGTSPDVSGSFSSGGYNLIGARDGAGGLANGVNHDQAGTQASAIAPMLGALANNGGPTPTMLLLPGSPAIDQGKSFGLTTDQRGLLRPYDFASISNAVDGDGSDIGAYELNVITATPATLGSVSFGSNQLQFLLTGTAGWNYIVQATTNLAGGDWIALVTNASPFTFVQSNANKFPRRFFRAVFSP